MVIVDSSVWIQYLRNPHAQPGRIMDALLAQHQVAMVGPVLFEILQGARTYEEVRSFSERLTALVFLDADVMTWVTMGEMGYNLRRAGVTLAFSDLLISSLAIQHAFPVYTHDRDFERVPGLTLYQAEEGQR